MFRYFIVFSLHLNSTLTRSPFDSHVFLGWTNPTGNFRQAFLHFFLDQLDQEAELQHFHFFLTMQNFISDYGTSLSLCLCISMGIFCAVKTGQLLGRNTFLQEIESFELEKMKIKTGTKLEFICKERWNTNDPLQLPVQEEPNIHHIYDFLEKSFLIDETVREKILGLTQMYIDLKNNGVTSKYFSLFLQYYENFFGGSM